MAAGRGDASDVSTRALADALLNAFALTGQSGFELEFTLDMPHLHLIQANNAAQSVFGIAAAPVTGEAIFDLRDLARVKLVVEPLLRRGEAWSGRLGVRPQAPTSASKPEPIELRATLWAKRLAPDGSTAEIAVVARRSDAWPDLATTDAIGAMASPAPEELSENLEPTAPNALDAELRFTPVIDLATGQTVQILATSHDPSSGAELRAGQRSEVVAVDDAATIAKALFDDRDTDAAHLSVGVQRRELRSALGHVEMLHAGDDSLPMNGLGFELTADLLRALHGVHLGRLHALADVGIPSTITVQDFPADVPPLTAGLLGAAGAGVVRLLGARPHDSATIERALIVASRAECALIVSGVSSPDEVDRVLDAGCGFATGPLFGRALSRGRLNRFLDQPVAAFASGS